MEFPPPNKLFLYDIVPPSTAGLYAFLDKNRKIIYVGKSSNLRKRLKIYLNEYFNFHRILTIGARIPKNYGPVQSFRLIIKRLFEVKGIKYMFRYGNKSWAEKRFIRKYNPKYNFRFVRDLEKYFFELQKTDNFLRKLFNRPHDYIEDYIPVRKE